HSLKPRVHETSAHPQRAPLPRQEEGYWEAEGLREDTQDYPSSVVSSHQEERGDFEAASPQSRNGNWCSFTQSRLVTYIEACMKEKYIVNSQQPCLNGAPDCQKIMYRTALKPVYQVKQKVLKSLQWKCCPGFIGKDCEQRDPNFILVPETETEGQEEEFSNHSISAYNDIMTLKNDIKHLSLAIKRHESRGDTSLCCNHTIANAIEPLNVSVETLSADLATIKRNLEEHLLTFKKLFGSNEELVASNVSLDVIKIQSMLNRKGRRQQKGQDKQRDKKRPEKHRENTQKTGRNTVQTELVEKDSLVAFHVGFSERKDKEKTVRFNETYLNYGNSYFSEQGHFKAPHKGVYLFVISVEFSSGPALGQLSFSRGYKRTLSSSQRKTPHGNTMTTFAMAEMEKGETVCFELLQGSVVKRSPPGTTMGGFLISKT
ncbi:Multimerin-2, partial [Corvus brachyrhynchos]